MKKLNIKIAIIQILGMVLLINGFLQLKLYSVAEKVICAKTHYPDHNSKYWNSFFPTNEDFFGFWPSVYIWIFFGLITGMLLVSFLNWKSKLSSLNSLLVAIVLYILLRFKFFRKEIISHLFQPVRTAFSNNYGTQCLFEGITFTILGLIVLYLSINPSLIRSEETMIEI